MKRPGLMLALVMLTLCAAPAWAVDLSKIDRAIPKEPQYQSKAPRYCLLVFGPEAKTRIWLVADGDSVHVSRTDGDLVGPGSRVVTLSGSANYFSTFIGDVTEVDGKTKHTNLRVYRFSDSWKVTVTLAGQGRGACRFQGAGYDPAEPLRFAQHPQDAPIIHFNGTRTLGLSGPKPTLQRGNTGTRITLGFGTPGLGQGTFAAFLGCAVPQSQQLVAVAAFPRAGDAVEKVYVRTVIGNQT